MTRFKDKLLKNFICKAALPTTQHKFNRHMAIIGRINFKAQQWLEVILLELWALSHYGVRRYGIMTTNMSEVFNSVLKGARNLPITALVQLTFFCINSYFVARKKQGTKRLASDDQYTSFVDAQIKVRAVQARSMEIVFYNHIYGRFHVKSRSGRTQRLNLHVQKCTCGKTLAYEFPCSYIIAACHHRYVDFQLFVQGYYTTQSYYDTWASLFDLIFNEDE